MIDNLKTIESMINRLNSAKHFIESEEMKKSFLIHTILSQQEVNIMHCCTMVLDVSKDYESILAKKVKKNGK